MHLIFWLKEGIINDFDKLDKMICAEIPDETITIKNDDGTTETVHNELHTLVVDKMLHGPCGAGWNERSCQRDGFCKSGYPQDYCNVTELNDDGYPKYRRRSPQDGGNTFEKRVQGMRYLYTNKDVVPYNKYLLYKYGSHINLEFVYSIHSMKYHLSYLYKGTDLSTVSISCANQESNEEDEVIDEIKNYEQRRFLGAVEAEWRMRGNAIAERKPSIQRLKIHLPNNQSVALNNNGRVESISIEKKKRIRPLLLNILR